MSDLYKELQVRWAQDPLYQKLNAAYVEAMRRAYPEVTAALVEAMIRCRVRINQEVKHGNL